jgi:hypothetical protein
MKLHTQNETMYIHTHKEITYPEWNYIPSKKLHTCPKWNYAHTQNATTCPEWNYIPRMNMHTKNKTTCPDWNYITKYVCIKHFPVLLVHNVNLTRSRYASVSAYTLIKSSQKYFTTYICKHVCMYTHSTNVDMWLDAAMHRCLSSQMCI